MRIGQKFTVVRSLVATRGKLRIDRAKLTGRVDKDLGAWQWLGIATTKFEPARHRLALMLCGKVVRLRGIGNAIVQGVTNHSGLTHIKLASTGEVKVPK